MSLWCKELGGGETKIAKCRRVKIFAMKTIQGKILIQHKSSAVKLCPAINDEKIRNYCNIMAEGFRFIYLAFRFS